MAYLLEVTDSNGNVIKRHVLGDDIVISSLVHQFHVDRKQVEFALGVIHAGRTMFDLSVVEETDDAQQIVWTARLSVIEGHNNESHN